MAAIREKFSSQASPELLSLLREIARKEGRQFQEVLEDAMWTYIETKTNGHVRPEVMAHFQVSLEKHRLLGELLAQ